ncbi:MAG TPA: hypothetical protein H9700_09360 [Candidatus Eisenbergiella intestinipullorum]|nr:hypothetical protein [Candidatus Eisenbergiella intestinipullorum]
MDQGIFSVKLCEMEQRYGKLQSRIQLCQTRDHDRIREEIRRMEEEEEEDRILLKKRMKGSGYPAAARLARALSDYEDRMRKILQEAENGDFSREHLKSENPEPAILYAEYAADFATQSMNYALLAALKAVDKQLSYEEKKGETTDE